MSLSISSATHKSSDIERSRYNHLIKHLKSSPNPTPTLQHRFPKQVTISPKKWGHTFQLNPPKPISNQQRYLQIPSSSKSTSLIFYKSVPSAAYTRQPKPALKKAESNDTTSNYAINCYAMKTLSRKGNVSSNLPIHHLTHPSFLPHTAVHLRYPPTKPIKAPTKTRPFQLPPPNPSSQQPLLPHSHFPPLLLPPQSLQSKKNPPSPLLPINSKNPQRLIEKLQKPPSTNEK